MKIKNLYEHLNDIAPFFLQENYDNSGVQFADLDESITNILISLDVTKDILDEAVENNSNTILCHHPLIFSPIKQIVKQKNPLLYQAVTRKINLIAMHTNYDLAEGGLNDYVAKMLGIKKIAPLQESGEKLFKFAVYVPEKYMEKLNEAIFEAGAGQIGKYKNTSFRFAGEGTFTPQEGTHPFIGKIGERETVSEIKIETIVSERNLQSVIQAMKSIHPYEEPAYDIYELRNKPSFGIGLHGMIGHKVNLKEYSVLIKNKLNAKCIRLIQSNNRPVKKIALCTGGGSSLLEQAGRLGIDVFITGDISYHHALRAKEMNLNILEVEHFDTEKFFVHAIYKQLIKSGISKDIMLKSNKMLSPYQLI